MNKLKSRLTVERIAQAYHTIDPVFLNTPQYRNESLGEYLQNELVLKVETANPLRSFKGRGCDWLVTQLAQEERLICASAGNFGQAMAYACWKKGIPLTVYASTRASPLKLERMQAMGAEVIRHGEDFDEAKLKARAVAEKSGVRFVEDSLDIETVEGAGTIGLELIRYPEKIDFLLLSLGNGALFNGIAKVFKQLSPGTRVIAGSAAGAPAMIESWRKGEIINHKAVNTIADGIAVRLPIPEALQDMHGLADEGLLVRDESILQAMQLLHQHAGLVAEPSAAAGIAAVLEQRNKFKDKRVATIICGGNLTRQQMETWL
jgi:threonine dehydratase